MSDFLASIMDPITLIILISIIIIGIIKKDKNLVTLLGIGGTFIGIVKGLHGIDSANISESIPNLLGGLYTAFYTSIAGIITSIIITLNEEVNKEEDLDKNSEQLLSDILSEINLLNKNIGGDGESSLLTQMQKLRTIFSDKQDELKNSFDDFAKEMAQNNTKALIEAIKQVMEDFNSKINNQLGESFKELSGAIDNLIVWQNEYKNNITTSTDLLKESEKSLKQSSLGFEITAEKASQFTGISESLGNELKSLNNSLDILKSGLKEFDGIAENSKESAAEINKSIESLKNNFVSKAETMISESEGHIRNMKDSFENQSSELKTIHKDILTSLKNEIENNSKITSEQFIGMQKNLEGQVLELDKKLGEELEKSLKTLGEQLSGLSGKFVSDYGSLAEKLERLVKLTK